MNDDWNEGYADATAGRDPQDRPIVSDYTLGYVSGLRDAAKSLTLTQYQRRAGETAIYKRAEQWGLIYSALGLASEAGEYAGKVKKLVRDATWSKEAAIAELGDVLWYVAACATDLGVSLSDVAEANLQKLADRKARNALAGSGDNR